MKRLSVLFSAIMLMALIAAGCSGNPSAFISPDSNPAAGLMKDSNQVKSSNTVLWGLYEVSIDIENQTVETVPLRTAEFTVNVVKFINQKPTNLKFTILETPVWTDYIDVDIDVTISHPFPGFHQYDGYDVRGIFMGNGSANLAYNPNLAYPEYGTDQYMLPDPDDGIGGPDGYTRWFNMTEFSKGGMPIFSYTPGKFASGNFAGTATLCPYKYFADGLNKSEDLGEWLENNVDKHGAFTAGTSNTRNYYLRFPTPTPGVKYGYAIIASWGGIEPEYHPCNTLEAVACDTDYTGDVYYVDPATKGGTLALDLDLYDWHGQPSTIFLESTVLSTPYEFSPSDMTPIGGNEIYSTYHVDVAADNVGGVEGNEYWVIAEYGDYDYTNPYGVPNDADGDTLAAFFRFDLEVSAFIPTQAPVCDIVINECTLHYWDITDHVAVEFDATASYDPDGDPLTFHWDFDNDDNYDEPVDDVYTGAPDNPSHDYFEDGVANLKLEDDQGAYAICSVDVDITEHQSKNIPLRDGWEARDFAVDPSNGELHILYYRHEISNDTHWVETYKYSPCDLYTEPDSAFHTQPQGKMFHRIDVSATHYSVIGGPLQGASGQVRNITPEGVDIGPNWVINCTEIWAFNDGGSYPYSTCTLYPFPGAPWNPSGYSSFLYRAPYDTTFDTWEQSALIYWGTQPVGSGYMYAGFVRGSEPVKSGNQFWTLQDPGNPAVGAYYCNRWSLDQSPGGLSGVNYNNAYFGTGSQTESDSGWYNAQDLTRNSQDNLLVLDKLSDGTGRVKAFTGDSSGGVSIGAFDIPDQVDANPLRIDSSDYEDPLYGNLVYILHGDSVSGYLLSVIFPDELPW